MGYLMQLWKGNVSLAKTYWIYGAGVTLIFKGVMTALDASSFLIHNYGIAKLVYYTFNGLFITYSIFIFGAIWNSATNYDGRVLWAGLAKFAVILGVITTLGALISLNEIDLNKEADHINKSLPAKIDEITRLESVSAGTKQMEFHYSIDRKMHEIDANRFAANMIGKKKGICSETDLKKYFQNGIKFIHTYKSSDNQLVTSLTIMPSDCGY